MSLLVLAVKYERKNPAASAVACETSAISGYGGPSDAFAAPASCWLSVVIVISSSWLTGLGPSSRRQASYGLNVLVAAVRATIESV